MADILPEFGRWVTNPRYFILEIVVLTMLLATGIAAPWLGARWFAAVERTFAALARRRVLACIVAGLAPVAVRLTLLPLYPAPSPEIHDEFSLLLGADTFASGRLTNPVHKLWEHFETFHVLYEPTYMTMYLPGQPLLLALGQVLGHPWIGVLIGTALMGAALTWMLQGWLPPRWALLGGLFAGARYATLSYWMDSYWGGQLAATGGALVIGATGRALRRKQVAIGDGVVFATGAALLALRRPFEGLVLCLVAGAVLLWMLGRRARVLRPAAAALAVLIPVIASIGYYNSRVTGHATLLPQVLAARQYLQINYWIFLPRPAVEPSYRHAAMRDAYRWEIPQYEARRSRFLATTKDHFVTLWRFYVGPALTVALIGVAWAWRDRRMRPLLAIAAAGIATMGVELWMFPHYAAPFAGVALILLLQGLRHVRQSKYGPAALRAVCFTVFVMLLLPPATRLFGWQVPPTMIGWWVIKEPWARHRIAAQLESTPGQHLVLVRYLPGHDLLKEWVYNTASIDEQKVVWARAMDEARDARLMDYFRGRTVWTLTEDGRDARLELIAPGAQRHSHLLQPPVAENR